MRLLLIIGLLLFGFSSLAQTDTIEQLQNKLKTAATPKKQVDILCKLSEHYFYTDTRISLMYSQKALKLAQQHNDQKGIASAYSCMGVIYLMTGNSEKASTLHYKALRIREAAKDTAGVGASYNNIANLLRDRKKYDAAAEFYNKSLQIAKLRRDTLFITKTYFNLGGIYLDQDKLNEALVYFEKTLQLNQKEFKVPPLNAIGVIYRRQGEWKKAIQYHTRALNLNKGSINYSDKAYALDGLTQAYYESGDLKKALVYAHQCFDLVKEMKLLNEMHLSALTLGDLYYDSGNFKKSHAYFTLYIQYKDSLYNADVDSKIEELRLTYRNEKAEQENKLLKTERNLKDQELERKNIVQIFIALLLLMACVAAFVFFKSKQHLAKINQLLVENSIVLNEQKEELTQQAALLQSQKQELERLHTVKDRLFSVIAHDLKGPLATLKGLLKLAATGAVPQEKFQMFMATLETSQQNALWLLDNLLIWAKSQMQGFSFTKEEISIYTLAEENIRLLSPQAQHKGVVLQNKITPDARAIADSETIKLVFRNLISNAIKFCSQDQSVTLTAERKGLMLEIAVTDTGTGIKPEHMPKLFGNNSFTTSGTAKEKGSGLGLTLCKEFVEQNGGSIRVESEYGIGTTFFFTLPVEREAIITTEKAILEIA